VFVVRTTLDVNLQRATERAVENSLRQYGQEYHAKQASTVVMDLDGSVRAMVGGRNYAVSQFNRATDAYRQPGSSFKPYVYATAFESGLKPSTVVVDGPICLGNWCPQNYGRSFAGRVTLERALVKSINTVPVRLSVMIGKGNPKAGRVKIVRLAKAMGLRHPLTDSSSLPIGAAEVSMVEHVGAYATFPNGGKAVTPHAILEVRTGTGELIWRYDREGPKPRRVMSEKTALEINSILNKVVEEGTGRRAQLEGIKGAGKTGTTNAYRDAWFVGFTGNYICGVWIGNDDYSSTNRMTGGSLPAMTWREIMTSAHQGIEIKPIAGVNYGRPTKGPARVAERESRETEGPPLPFSLLLTRHGADVLVRMERLFDEARRALIDAPQTTSQNQGGTQPPGPVASASGQPNSGLVRGN
jgi:penicillin-binding protein 1A